MYSSILRIAHIKRTISIVTACALALALGIAGLNTPLQAQSGSPYELSWGNIGAAGASSGGAYTLDSAIGQPDAGGVTGGNYSLAGGFFASPGALGPLLTQRTYLPVVQR